jgi:uncharacterized protein
MTYWPWEVGGLALAGVMLLHWLATHRMMAVSGRYTALVNRVRLGAVDDDAPIDTAALVAAMRAATIEQFGAGAVEDVPTGATDAGAVSARAEPPLEAQGVPDHLLFLACLALGGLGSALLSGRFHVTLGLASAGFAQLTHGSPWLGGAVLIAGGMLVGFGTRMAGGCTSGHGMCGVSRFQKGSLLATVAFFGTGVVTALALGLVR